jgi:hypothetical protein
MSRGSDPLYLAFSGQVIWRANRHPSNGGMFSKGKLRSREKLPAAAPGETPTAGLLTAP